MKRLHAWPRTAAAAIAMQRRLAASVVARPIVGVPRFIGGADCAFEGDATIVAAAVIWDAVEDRLVESRVVRRPLRFPYVPGLLSFRETPAILAALATLLAGNRSVIVPSSNATVPGEVVSRTVPFDRGVIRGTTRVSTRGESVGTTDGVRL